MAVNNETLDDLLQYHFGVIEHAISEIIITCPIFFLFALSVLALTFAHRCLQHNYNNGGTKTKTAKVVYCAAVVCITWLLYMVGLDSAAVYYQFHLPDHELQYIYHTDNAGNPHDIFFRMPHIILSFDVFMAFVIILAAALCLVFMCTWYTIGVIIIICAVLGSVNHLPFIAMAYLDDPYHATSIFVYYILIICGLIAVAHFNYSEYHSESSHKCKHVCIIIVVSILRWFFFLGVMIIIGVYFYFLPIDKSISKAPNELLSIHQTVFVLVGGFVLYKTVITHDESLKKGQSENVTPTNQTMTDQGASSDNGN